MHKNAAIPASHTRNSTASKNGSYVEGGPVKKKRIIFYALASLALCLTAWACSWLRIEPFSSYSFFPLWLGYTLFIDALVLWRTGSSLLIRSRWRFLLLFLASSCFWWIFEGLNKFVQNWYYELDHPYSPFAFFAISTLDFSTVLAAVLETAELLFTFKVFRPRLPASQPGPRLPLWVLTTLTLVGLACLALILLWPHYSFGLVWLSIFFLLDPINNLLGRKSSLAHFVAKDWRFFYISLAGLICGFFWEMWNYYSLPKWHYSVPFIGFWKIFEMPLLGYSGYLPFALELFAMYQLLLVLIGQRDDYLSF